MEYLFELELKLQYVSAGLLLIFYLVYLIKAVLSSFGIAYAVIYSKCFCVIRQGFLAVIFMPV